MTSTSDIYVWVWLPGETTPVAAGVLLEGPPGQFTFTYGNRYRRREGAIALSPTMPLDLAESSVSYGPTGAMPLPGALRDATPDSWGRRVILNTVAGRRGPEADTIELDERAYMMASGSNRLGAIDFQASTTDYVPRQDDATLDDLLRAADLVEAGEPMPPALQHALLSGTALGGAQPKALVRDGDKEFLAKFPVSSDTFPTVGAEAASTYIAAQAGLRVPSAQMATVLGKNVLLTERFDRPGGGRRTPVVSGLTLLELDEQSARYGTYPLLLEALRKWGNGSTDPGPELFARIAFNMLISNMDDHLRNHAAFWDGKHLQLTPVYDLSPGLRSGETAFQHLAYGANGERASNVADLVNAAALYGLSRPQALEIADQLIGAIDDNWDDAADFAGLKVVEKSALRGRQFLNPGSMYGLPKHVPV